MFWISFMFWLSFIGTPVSAGFAWWFWSRRHRSASRGWRPGLLMTGILAVSANALIYYLWFSYRLLAGNTPQVWALKETFRNVCIWLVPLALFGAVGGKGPARIPVAICALLGCMNWVPIAIL